MSSFLIHLLIPPLAALQVRALPARRVWAWVWVGILPDLDYLGWIFYVNGWIGLNFHRALFHNVFITLILAAAAFAGLRAFAGASNPLSRATVSAYIETRRGAGWFLATYYHFTHLLLDSFQGGIVPFFPILRFNFYQYFYIFVDTETQKPVAEAGAGVEQGVPDVSAVYPWLTSEQLAILILVVVCLGWSAWATRRAAAPPAPVAPANQP